MKKFRKLFMLLACCVMMFPSSVYAETVTQGSIDEKSSTNNSTNSSTNTDTTDDTSSDTTGDTTSDTTTDTTSDTTDDAASKINSKVMLCDNWEIPTVTYGQQVNIVLPLVNMDKTNITDVIVTPVVSTETASFPFEIEKTGYTVELTELLGSNAIADPLERRQEITYTFRARNDISTGYYAVNFQVIFKNAEGTEETATIPTYVKTIGKRGAGSTSDSKSVPRMIVTGFETVPADVHAGEDFTLTLHIKNTSNFANVANIKCDLQAATDGTDENAVTQAFLPKQGSSTIFLDSIGMGETKDISIDMNAKADLTQKPYVLNVKMEYEDDSYNQFTSDASVSIPVKQEARFEISAPEVMPASIQIGSESNVMFSIYNTGKTIMYNTTVKFEAASITGGDTYVGKIQTGETGNVDAMVTGQAATADDGTVKVLITYEDEAGNPTTVEKSLTLSVLAGELPATEDMGEDLAQEDVQDSGSSAWVFVIIIFIVIVIVGVIGFLKVKKMKKDKQTENDLLADIDSQNEYDDIKSIYGEEEIDEDEDANEEFDEVTNSDKKEAPQKEGDDDEIS
jgi:cytoskeletal protein RodZ